MKKITIFSVTLLPMLLLVYCGKMTPKFEDFLYELAEMEENERSQALDNWLSEKEEFPVVEDNTVYFIYKEKKEIPISVAGDFNQWQKDDSQMLKIIGTDYYFFKTELPSNAAVQYKFYMQNDFTLDPLNMKTAESGIGTSSLLLMPYYKYPIVTLTKRNFIYTNPDTILTNDKSVVGFLFKTQNADSSIPLLIINKGSFYNNHLQVGVIRDNLITDGVIKPVSMLLLNEVNIADNPLEYGRWLFESIIPVIEKKHNVLFKNIIIGGISEWGNPGLYAMLEFPKKIKSVFIQNPQIGINELSLMHNQSAGFENVSIYMDYSLFERRDSTLIEFEKLLKKKDINFISRVYNEGNSYLSLKRRFVEILTYIFSKNDA